MLQWISPTPAHEHGPGINSQAHTIKIKQMKKDIKVGKELWRRGCRQGQKKGKGGWEGCLVRIYYIHE